MAKSFAIPSNAGGGNHVNQTVKGNGGKAGSIHLQKRVSDFDNTLVSNTVDFTHLAASGSNMLQAAAMPSSGNQANGSSSQKDKQMLYKKMF
mmetsp:Transcript_122/g.241  ORF Transcript_122/g.241 Transcript_122/m.241 type:complete len:92 (-) Transcript_122:730-1005(-)|eukprot:CAMPEP_0185571684 /NCGR_PEP_ID=MMETSP0434-20130131/3690_1 /TAXON_ID=626734 ORGANISM="Favella taraikaensis, Strain Fe Narragansett Bay" /NCGR_SAMPLE_ID=MMETSP0434 /ASSEMBLY_ACC=CAM_ASM_000379 /LENGTH=91 /DNA_ID=CAMNT_0028187225 /DNA_START=1314 /DNA_END=1589 /DNA_ORIENTATION=+